MGRKAQVYGAKAQIYGAARARSQNRRFRSPSAEKGDAQAAPPLKGTDLWGMRHRSVG